MMTVISGTALLWWLMTFGAVFFTAFGLNMLGRLDVRVFVAFTAAGLWLTAGVCLLSPARLVAVPFVFFAAVYSWLWSLTRRVLGVAGGGAGEEPSRPPAPQSPPDGVCQVTTACTVRADGWRWTPDVSMWIRACEGHLAVDVAPAASPAGGAP